MTQGLQPQGTVHDGPAEGRPGTCTPDVEHGPFNGVQSPDHKGKQQDQGNQDARHLVPPPDSEVSGDDLGQGGGGAQALFQGVLNAPDLK